MVERTLIRPPVSRIGPITPAERQATLAASPVSGRYDEAVDRESAYEMLKSKAEKTAQEAAEAEAASERVQKRSRGGYRRQSVAEAATKSIVRSIGHQIGRELVRGILGSLFRRR